MGYFSIRPNPLTLCIDNRPVCAVIEQKYGNTEIGELSYFPSSWQSFGNEAHVKQCD